MQYDCPESASNLQVYVEINDDCLEQLGEYNSEILKLYSMHLKTIKNITCIKCIQF